MKIAIGVMSLCLASAAPAFATPASQPLSIGLGGDGAQATRLPTYDPRVPIAVTVNEPPGRHADAVALEAAGPAGQHLDVRLGASGGARFGATFALPEQGAWTVRVRARSGSQTTQTDALTLQVRNPPPSSAPWIGFAAGSGTFSMLSGAYVLLRRVARRAPRPARTRVA